MKRYQSKINLIEANETAISKEVADLINTEFLKLFAHSKVYVDLLRDESQEVSKEDLYMSFTFNFKLNTANDPFLDNETYSKGNAYINLNDKAKKTVESFAKKYNFSIGFNNTGSIFWLTKRVKGITDSIEALKSKDI